MALYLMLVNCLFISFLSLIAYVLNSRTTEIWDGMFFIPYTVFASLAYLVNQKMSSDSRASPSVICHRICPPLVTLPLLLSFSPCCFPFFKSFLKPPLNLGRFTVSTPYLFLAFSVELLGNLPLSYSLS